MASPSDQLSSLKPFSTRRLGLILGPLLFVLTYRFFHPEGLSLEANAVLATTLWVAVWWITEAVPIPITSLLPIVLFPLTGGMDIETTAQAYGHKYVYLYIGGFIIAIAIERWNLHRRIALNIISLIGSNMSLLVLGFMVATAFLSMWISNTATAVMMLPIGMAIISQMAGSAPGKGRGIQTSFGKALMLAIAYSASIGGIATLIGTPPNLVLAGVVKDLYGIEITFAQWIKFGLPISMILLFICWQYLVRFAYPMQGHQIPGGRAEISRQLKSLGRLTYEEKWVLFVFVLTGLAWICRSFLLKQWLPAIDDTIIALIGAAILFLLPSRNPERPRIMDWESAVKLPWGILILFGGGFALASGFKVSGLAEWIGGQMTLLEGVSLIVLLLAVIAAVNFLTEITSNVATTSMLLPVLAPMALVIDVHPYALMIGATVAASCAYMLPVATPPNAVVFGSGYLTIPDMMRTGFALNVLSIFLILLFTYFMLPLVWNIDLSVYPEVLK